MFDHKKLGNIGSHVKSGSSFQVFSYLGDVDDKATIIASGYFNTIKESLRRNDIIKVLDKTVTPVNTYEVMVSVLPLSGDVQVTELEYFSAASNIHNSLTGLQGGAAGNYYHSDQDVNTTASPTFAGVTIASNAWKVFYSNGSSALTALALGASGTVLQSNGASSAPSFATPTAGGGVGLETVLMLGGM